MSRLLALLVVTVAPAAAAAQDGPKEWLKRLGSDRPAEWRIAQAHLARLGAAALPDLAALAAKADAPLRQRVSEVVAMMLLKKVTPAQLAEHKALAELVRPEFERAEAHLKLLLDAKKYDSGERGLGPPGSKPPPLSSERKAVKALTDAGGWAVPAALRLIDGKTPASRIYGAEILTWLSATAQRTLLDQLTADKTAIEIFRGDFMDRTTVGKVVGDWLRTHSAFVAQAKPDPKYAACFEAEGYLIWLARFAKGKADDTDLVNRLRQAGTIKAASWDDYWERARPLLEKFFAEK